VDAIDDPFFAALVSAVEDGAIGLGLDVVGAATRFDPARERAQLLRLAGQRPRGIILAPTGDAYDFLQPYRATTPIVTVDRLVNGFDSITVDDEAGARRAVEHLIVGGHRRIALIGYDPRFGTSRRRREGYEAVLRRHGIDVPAEFCPEVPFASASARDAVHAVLALPEPPSALFLANARHATTVVSALHEIARTDLAVVSFGDFTLADAVRPAISCIDQDPRLMGTLAFERLIELSEHSDQEPEHHVMPTTFVTRSSHDIPAHVAGSLRSAVEHPSRDSAAAQ
ncbi:MAG: substrate-binding domain-containing protein, partial [Micrococcales bacterium]|nr:substrate-binding domain-containing protein [Micrococcales bacterium]